VHFWPGPACRARGGAVSCENNFAATPRLHDRIPGRLDFQEA